MSTVLLIAEHDGSALNAATAKALTCARDVGEVHIAVLSAGAVEVCASAAALDGVTRVLNVVHEQNAQPVAAILAPQIVALAADYGCVVLPSTTFGKDLAPRVAALLGAHQVSDVMEVLSPTSFKRPIYAGNVIITETIDDGSTIVLSARTASYQATAAAGAAAPIDDVTPDVLLPTHTRFVSVSASSSERPDLQSASWVVSGGRGVGSEENFKVIYDLADRLGAGVGASRAAVDAGFVPNDMQVGQTGKIIAPDVYFAFGISGAIQHITGIKDAGTIVAINKDAEAPIFEVADIGLVGDLFELAPQIGDALGK
jgi:electron transfer flavoprotein alpha subunit